MSEWATINRYPNYEINTDGTVRTKRTGHIKKQGMTGKYPSVHLYIDNTQHIEYIHRLVAETFVVGYKPKLEVNHIDGHKQNSRSDNLEWCTRSENVKHSYDTGLRKPSSNHPIRPIKVSETGVVYPSIRECARGINGDASHIQKCLIGERKRHLGYHFEYV